MTSLASQHARKFSSEAFADDTTSNGSSPKLPIIELSVSHGADGLLSLHTLWGRVTRLNAMVVAERKLSIDGFTIVNSRFVPRAQLTALFARASWLAVNFTPIGTNRDGDIIFGAR